MPTGRKLGSTYKTHLWPEGHRECVKCNNILPFSMFHKHKECHGGYNTVCKTCRKPVSTVQWTQTPLVKKILSRCKSRSKLHNLEFNLTEDDIVIPSVCPVLLVPFNDSLEYTPSVDRIDPTKGYIKGNVQIMSNKANRMKSNATPTELRLFAQWVIRECL